MMPTVRTPYTYVHEEFESFRMRLALFLLCFRPVPVPTCSSSPFLILMQIMIGTTASSCLYMCMYGMYV